MSAGRKNINTNIHWNTPPKYIDAILKFWPQIDLDPCANEYSLVPALNKIELPKDGLKESWDYPRIFVNPPYGRDSERKTSIYNWINKGFDANIEYRSELLYLIPVATNTSHFKEIIFPYFFDICFLADTRLKFYKNGVEDKKGAPMACCMCYIGENSRKFEEVFSKYGKVVAL